MEGTAKKSGVNWHFGVTAIAGLLLLLSLFLCLVLLAVSWRNVAPTLYWQFHYLAVVVLVTAFTRTITIRKVLGFYFLGIGASAILALIASTPAWLILDYPLWVDVPVPIVEETAKITPLLVLVLWPRSPWRKSAGLSDFLAAGAALGSGFGLLEDLLRGWEWQRMLDLRIGPHLGPVYLFPAADLQSGISPSSVLNLTASFLGHGPGTAMIALAVGVAVIYGRRQGWQRALIALPLLAWAWVTWDHVWFNLSSDGAFDGVTGAIQSLVGLRGHLSSWVLLAGGIAAIIVDAVAIRGYWSQAAGASRLKLNELSLWRRPLDRRTPLYLYLWLITLPQLRRMAAYAARNGVASDVVLGAVDRLSASLKRRPKVDQVASAASAG